MRLLLRKVALGAAVSMVPAFSLAGCRSSRTKAALRYWDAVEARSVSVAGTFLNVATSGDSTSIAAVSTDSLAGRIMTFRRQSTAPPLFAAAAQFRTAKKEVTVLGIGASVDFSYQLAGSNARLPL